MPRLCHPGAAYGCNHHSEHQEAARKGWLTRRRNAPDNARYKQVAAAFSEMFGGDVTHIHAHHSHPGEVQFKQGGRWYSLPKKEYLYLAREGVTAQKDRAKAEARAAKQAEAERKRGEKRAAIESRQRERVRRAEDVYARRMQAAMDREEARQWKPLASKLAKYGIHSKTMRGELAYLPSRFVRVNKRGSRTASHGTYTIEEVGEMLQEEGLIFAGREGDLREDEIIEVLGRLEDKHKPNGQKLAFERDERERRRNREQSENKASMRRLDAAIKRDVKAKAAKGAA